MRWIQLPLGLSVPEKGVLATLTLAATDDGLCTVGASITSLTTLEPLALVATSPVTQENLASRADEVLRDLGLSVATLLDWPPFP